MFHPTKPWRMPFSALVGVHNVTRVAPAIWGGVGFTTPINVFANPGGTGPLPGAMLFVRDQRASGMNAVLFRDPSMIL